MDQTYDILFEKWNELSLSEESLDREFQFDFRNDMGADVYVSNRFFDVKIREWNEEERSFNIWVEGIAFKLNIRDDLDKLIKKMNFQKNLGHSVKEIRAPIPGMILEILVLEGQKVNARDGLCVIEAMKMQNLIHSSDESTIKKVHVKSGLKVEKNQLLFELD